MTTPKFIIYHSMSEIFNLKWIKTDLKNGLKSRGKKFEVYPWYHRIILYLSSNLLHTKIWFYRSWFELRKMIFWRKKKHNVIKDATK